MKPAYFLYVLLLSVWWPLTSVWAQYNQFETFTINDGLAHTECNLIHVDQNGELWVLHHLGWLSRFNGKKFITYSPEQIGIHWPGGHLLENKEGIWLIKNPYLANYSTTGWKDWNISAYIGAAFIDKATDQIILLDTADHLYCLDSVSDNWIKFSTLPPNTGKTESLIVPSRTKDRYLLIQYIPNAEQPMKSAFTSPSLRNPVWTSIDHKTVMTTEWEYNELKGTLIQQLNFKLPTTDIKNTSEILHTSNGRLFLLQVAPTSSKSIYHYTIYEIYDDVSHTLIASLDIPHQEATLAVDRKGHLWITSHNGLTRVYPEVLQCFDDVPNMISSLHTINEDDHGNIWFGGYTTGLSYFNGVNIQAVPQLSEKYPAFLPGPYRNKDGQMAFWVNKSGLVVYEKGKWSDAVSMTGKTPPLLGFYFLETQTNQIAAGLSGYGLGLTDIPLKADSEWKIVDPSKGMHLINVLTIAEDKSNRLWLGRYNQGVAIYDVARDTARTWLYPDDIPYGMMSSVMDKEGRLWMGCSDGLRFIEKPERVDMFRNDLHSIAKKIFMDEAGYSQVQSLKVLNDYLVFGNNLGYGFLDLKNFKPFTQTPRIYFTETIHSGLSCEQNAMLVDSKGYLWIGLDKGAIRIDLEKQILDSLPVQLKIERIISRGIGKDSIQLVVRDESEIQLPYRKRNVTIEIAPAFSGMLTDNVFIQYSLLSHHDGDTIWSPPTKNFSFRIDILPPGKSELVIRAIKNNQIADVRSYSLYVPPILSERPLFWISIFGLLSLSGFMFMRHIYHQRLQLRSTQIKLIEKNREKIHFQINALANALNPHFIKNALSWVKLVIDNKLIEDVIEKLAINIGLVFDYSQKGNVFHTLEEEFKLLENYISIQLSIYGDFFSIHLPEKSEWKTFSSIKVPLMQMQIHAENAIEHGLRPKPFGIKTLKFEIKEINNNYIELIIEDNGIGREEAKRRSSSGTRQGIQMLSRIHELYNELNELKFTTQIMDLYDNESNKATGTRIYIQIPKKFNIELI